MYDAISLAAGQLDGRPGRRVMVIITDGGDTSSRTTFHQALEEAQRIDAVIYGVIVMPIKADAGRNVGGENALKTLAANTGGATYVQFGDVDLNQAFDEILRNLRTQYLIGYYPPEHTSVTERFRPVEIKVSRPEATVLARNGYFVPDRASRRNPKERISIRGRPSPPKPDPKIKSRTGTKKKGDQP
jgi:Ca-activated chloride channel family protein